MSETRLSLQECYDGDPDPQSAGSQLRFLCPLCGNGKSRDNGHRSLSADTDAGVYFCFRCGLGGKFGDEAFQKRSPETVARIRREAAQRTVEENRQRQRILIDTMNRTVPLDGTAGAAYLRGRAIKAATAQAANVRYLADFFGRPAVMFPAYDNKGKLCALQGRYLDNEAQVRMRTIGFPKRGVFYGNFKRSRQAYYLHVTEAPIDALSLEEMGHGAVAVFGTRMPSALVERAERAGIELLLASVNDKPGDVAATKWAAMLDEAGVRHGRRRPERAKDWNAQLLASYSEHHRHALQAFTPPVGTSVATALYQNRAY